MDRPRPWWFTYKQEGGNKWQEVHRQEKVRGQEMEMVQLRVPPIPTEWASLAFPWATTEFSAQARFGASARHMSDG
jgi:hypothetical protein